MTVSESSLVIQINGHGYGSINKLMTESESSQINLKKKGGGAKAE